MTEAGMKPLPEAVMVSAALPAVAEFGVTPLSVGTGLELPPPFDPPPPPQPIIKQRKKDARKRFFQRLSREVCFETSEQTTPLCLVCTRATLRCDDEAVCWGQVNWKTSRARSGIWSSCLRPDRNPSASPQSL